MMDEKTPSAPYSEQFDDIYFSKENGVEETTHVFVNGNNLEARFAALKPDQIFTIGETGFGTGLNLLVAAALFLRTAPASSHLYFYSVEKFPLAGTDIEKYLKPWRHLFPELFDHFLDQYPLRVGGWHKIQLHDRITAIIAFDDVARAVPNVPTTIDAWFLDGFAPAKNPDMWTQDLFDALASHSYTETTLASFTAAGNVRRGLEQVGFRIEKTNGYGHKRDMICGKFVSENRIPAARFLSSPQKIAIIGAGLAGAQMAYHLMRDRHKVMVFDMNDVASGASGNQIGLYNPRLSTDRTPISEFFSSAFSAVTRSFKHIYDVDFHACGALHLMSDEAKEKRFHQCITSWDWHNDHAEIISPKTASNIAGTEITQQCLYLKDSGYVSPQKLCHKLLYDIPFQRARIQQIMRAANNKWLVNNQEFDHVVLASGASHIDIEGCETLPIQSVRGQIAIVENKIGTYLPVALCFGGYMSPTLSAGSHAHILGSSFQPWLDDPNIRDEDNFGMLKKLYENIPSLNDQMEVKSARVGFRASSPDRIPMIGPYPHAPSLWVSGAHGSHGLLSSLMAARIISNQISGRPPEIGQNILSALDPIRFENRAKNDKTKP